MAVKVRITAKKKENTPVSVAIHTEFIKLQDFLKFCDAVPSGGVAKMLVQDGQILVNGQVCTMRGKKLVPGDVVSFDGNAWAVAQA